MDLTTAPTLDDLIKALPLDEKIPVIALKKILDQRERIDDEQENKINQIKVKYNAKVYPLLQRVFHHLIQASEILKGSAIKPEEVPCAKEIMKGENLDGFLKGKVIEGYWNGVFSNSRLVDDISAEDEKALGYLLSIEKVDNPEDLDSIELKFIFKPNPYFHETELRRKVVIKDGDTLCVEGDKITWREGQCLTHTLKKVTNKKTGEKSTIQGEKIASFFDIFLDYDKQKMGELTQSAEMLSEISAMVTVDSIDYFLGSINEDEESADDQDDGRASEEK